jgi:hypothetical protein
MSSSFVSAIRPRMAPAALALVATTMFRYPMVCAYATRQPFDAQATDELL